MDRRQSSARCGLASGRFARAHKSGSVVRRSDGDSLRAFSLREIAVPRKDSLHLTARKPGYTTRRSVAGETVRLNRDRGASHDAPPPTPPGIRVRTTAVRRIKRSTASPWQAGPDV